MVRFLSYEEIVAIYYDVMTRIWKERFYGVRDEALLRSALARPEQAATYEDASLIRQAAYLFHGLLKNHPFYQGNKRTAFYCLVVFLDDNGFALQASNDDVIELAFKTEDAGWTVDDITQWLELHAAPLSNKSA